MEREIIIAAPTNSGSSPAAPVNEELAKIIEESSIEGLNGAMLVFMQKRGLAFDDKAPIFAGLLTAEFSPVPGQADEYPLSKSIRERVIWAINEGHQTFCALYANGEENNLRKLIRVIVSGEMLTVMQDNLEEVMKAYNDLK